VAAQTRPERSGTGEAEGGRPWRRPSFSAVALAVLRLGQCAWPVGDPGERDFSFCCLPTGSTGAADCPEHDRLAHLPQVPRAA